MVTNNESLRICENGVAKSQILNFPLFRNQ